jgi:hypothetical protein
VLHLWLCTHHSDIQFLTRHFVVYHDELFQQYLLAFPLKCPKFLALAEQKLHSWYSPTKNFAGVRSGECIWKEICPLPADHMIKNVVISLWKWGTTLLEQNIWFVL